MSPGAEDLILRIVSGLILMLLGAVGTGVAWLVRSVLKLKADMNAAFCKIRTTQEDVKELFDERSH